MFNRLAKKITAITLAVIMTLGISPLNVISGAMQTEDLTILSFAPLSPDTANRTVPFGTQLWELNLPMELEAEVLLPPTSADADTSPFRTGGLFGAVQVHAAEVGEGDNEPEADNDPPESDGDGENGYISNGVNGENGYGSNGEGDTNGLSPYEPQQPTTPGTPSDIPVLPQIVAMPVPVTWQSSPAFNGEIPGVYIFTPIVGFGFALAYDVWLPTITVVVEPQAATPIFGFMPLAPETAEQTVRFGTNIWELDLPEILWANF
jgi:hypothetical protein